MALIKINNLQPAGFDLFNDSEDYLNELTGDGEQVNFVRTRIL